ncbi:NfeD family protein [Paenibacillus sp. NFR01]|uniref:NfeD family protein n=1 Tax=Paenibacillus sp. NFR01 TaxID=1566279 RepID=UPI0008CCE0F6|nr:NfeD family protein [Paenibacillus sp. NFR01]SEU18205.1 Membrane protein implicated in regulation of membrane protease activity [Paenibacillus sp. NFR01]
MVMWVVWLIAASVLLVVEMMTLTFYLLWLSIGAVAALLVSLIAPDMFLLQALVGSVVALVLTVFTKPLAARLRSSRGFKDTGVELVGRRGVVVEPIIPGSYGQVKIGGDTWSAVSAVPIDRAENVRIVGRSSTILEVERWEEII